jgi:hypothetical protein
MAVLIQYAKDDGPIHLFEPWKNPIKETLRLIEEICDDEVVGFNLAFDHFHLCKLYTTFSLYHDWDAYPEDVIDELAELEPLGRDGPCLKVKSACDLMLHARKGRYQSTMDRRPIMIRKVPTVLAWELAEELEKRIPLPDYYFARKKKRVKTHWSVRDIEGNKDFKNLVLDFAPSSALKVIAKDVLGFEETMLFQEIECNVRPEEVGWAPFAKAIGEKGAWNRAWPVVIYKHIDHWHYNKLAREYAEKDVHYTREVWKSFGSPAPGDADSVLACMVAASRWRGYRVDLEQIKSLKEEAKKKLRSFSANPRIVKRYIGEVLDESEKAVIQGSTKKRVLEEISQLLADCPNCEGNGCDKCENGVIKHPAASRALEVLDARKAKKEIELYDKILQAGRFHASFKVIGTLSSRMAGADGLNAQGIKKAKNVRSAFPLSWPGYVLTGGDFSGFEVTIADAVYNDPKLRQDLLSGKKIHALFGVNVFPNMTYEEICATDGSKTNDIYGRCKSAVFAMFYGGTGFTLKDRLNVDLEIAEKAVALFHKQYKEVSVETIRVTKMFTSLSQNEIGGRITYHASADYIESMYGFRRYFTLENRIIKALFDLGEKPPQAWTKVRVKVCRRIDRGDQTASGAVRSALFGAAFGVMSGIIRAAKNHKIQSAGASITKALQRRIWDLQPSGVNDWLVQPMNIHDEIMNPSHPSVVKNVEKVVNNFVEETRPKVPLVAIDWKSNLNSWADKS